MHNRSAALAAASTATIIALATALFACDSPSATATTEPSIASIHAAH